MVEWLPVNGMPKYPILAISCIMKIPFVFINVVPQRISIGPKILLAKGGKPADFDLHSFCANLTMQTCPATYDVTLRICRVTCHASNHLSLLQHQRCDVILVNKYSCSTCYGCKSMSPRRIRQRDSACCATPISPVYVTSRARQNGARCTKSVVAVRIRDVT